MRTAAQARLRITAPPPRARRRCGGCGGRRHTGACPRPLARPGAAWAALRATLGTGGGRAALAAVLALGLRLPGAVAPAHAGADWWPDVCAPYASLGQLDACLGRFYGVNAAFMERLSTCETSGAPQQIILDTNGQYSYGRYQYQPGTFWRDLAASNATPDGSGIDSDGPMNLYLNTKLAFYHVAHYGTGAWYWSVNVRMPRGEC